MHDLKFIKYNLIDYMKISFLRVHHKCMVEIYKRGKNVSRFFSSSWQSITYSSAKMTKKPLQWHALG
jgi:hypothetical protein